MDPISHACVPVPRACNEFVSPEAVLPVYAHKQHTNYCCQGCEHRACDGENHDYDLESGSLRISRRRVISSPIVDLQLLCAKMLVKSPCTDFGTNLYFVYQHLPPPPLVLGKGGGGGASDAPPAETLARDEIHRAATCMGLEREVG